MLRLIIISFILAIGIKAAFAVANFADTIKARHISAVERI